MIPVLTFSLEYQNTGVPLQVVDCSSADLDSLMVAVVVTLLVTWMG